MDHRDQQIIWGSLLPSDTWVYCEISNHTIGDSNWYAGVGGQTLLHGLRLMVAYYWPSNPRWPCTQALLRSTAERWSGVAYDNSTSSAYHKMKDSNGNWFDWTSLVVGDGEPDWWNPVKVHNRWWYTTWTGGGPSPHQ
jgi:hypothetical protein